MIAALERNEAGPRNPGGPASNGTLASLRQCMTRVGTLTCGSSAPMSTSPFARKLRAASSGKHETRCRSLNQSACSLLAPGMNWVVNICRKAGFSWPHPSRIKVSIAFPAALSASVLARFFQPTA